MVVPVLLMLPRKILNVPASLPLYFTATALAKLAHQARLQRESCPQVNSNNQKIASEESLKNITDCPFA